MPDLSTPAYKPGVGWGFSDHWTDSETRAIVKNGAGRGALRRHRRGRAAIYGRVSVDEFDYEL
jgi:hypothetical protein